MIRLLTGFHLDVLRDPCTTLSLLLAINQHPNQVWPFCTGMEEVSQRGPHGRRASAAATRCQPFDRRPDGVNRGIASGRSDAF